MVQVARNVFPASAVRQNLNATVAALNYNGAADMDKEEVALPAEAKAPPAHSVVGCISVILGHLRQLVMKGIHESNEEFKNQVNAKEESTRIKKAM